MLVLLSGSKQYYHHSQVLLGLTTPRGLTGAAAIEFLYIAYIYSITNIYNYTTNILTNILIY